MIVFPNCKINLGLNIVSKRNDGFHNLETVFYPITIQDVLEIVDTSSIQKTDISSTHSITTSAFNCTTTGLSIQVNVEDNLCYKAYYLLKRDFSQLPPIQVHLHKTIPMGAGLGGGSADGAFTLQLLNEKFQLNLSSIQLIHYAAQLGSDCPFFILNKPCFATGKGEQLEPIKLDLSAYYFIIVYPGIHIDTKWAFSQITPTIPQYPIAQIIQQPLNIWKSSLINDFEVPVCSRHPEIATIKQQLYNAGAAYAAMSGSGSTVFGIFDSSTHPKLSFPKSYLVKKLKGNI